MCRYGMKIISNGEMLPNMKPTSFLSSSPRLTLELSRKCNRDHVHGALVGGLYGISLKGVFFGESMFSRATDSSKVALVHLAAKLSVGGYAFIDTQFITKHLSRFGAVEVPRNEYRGLLAAALKFDSEFGVDYDAGDLEAILHQ